MATAKKQEEETKVGNVVIVDADEVLVEGSTVHNLAIQKCSKVVIRDVANPF